MEGYSNVGHLLLNPKQSAWHYGDPVGLQANLSDINDKDQALALAYLYLSIPISLPTSWEAPHNYLLQDAQRALLDDMQGLTATQAVYPIISELPKDHYDGLTFTAVHPRFLEHCYNADGTQTTKLQCKQLEEDESTDMAEASKSDDLGINTPPQTATVAEIMEEVRATGTPAPAPLHSRGNKVIANVPNLSVSDSLNLNPLETSSRNRHDTLQLHTTSLHPPKSPMLP